MYYDLCPWQYCGCPFCVEVPPSTKPPPLTTSTLIRQVETTTEPMPEETTTTEAPETTTETTAADTEAITTELPTTTEMIPAETEEPETTSRPRRTTVSSNGPTCTTCICNSWQNRITRWHPPPPRFTNGSCQFCGHSWMSGSIGRNNQFQSQFQPPTRDVFRPSRWSMNGGGRWGNMWRRRRVYGDGGGPFGSYGAEVEVLMPQRSFNRLSMGNSFLFG